MALKLCMAIVCIWLSLLLPAQVAVSDGSLLFIRMPDEPPIDHEPTDVEIESFLKNWQSYLGMTAQELRRDREFARQVLGQNRIFAELLKFREQYHIKTRTKFVFWSDALAYLRDYVSIPDNPPVVVQLGDTWEAYFRSLGVMPYSQRFQYDVRLLWYWKDLINPQEIADGPGFVAACQRLKQGPLEGADLIAPFVINTAPDWDLLHNLGIWLHNAGLPDLISTRKKFGIIPWKEAVFANAEGEKAVEFLMNLAENGYVDLPEKNNIQVMEDFLRKKYAMTIMPPFTWHVEAKLGLEWQSQIGTTLPPAIGAETRSTFRGGSLIVVLDPSRGGNPDDVGRARRLMEFLCSAEVAPAFGPLPGNPQALERSEYFEVYEQALDAGKSYPAIPEWAPVVENLTTRDSLYALWKRISALRDYPTYRIRPENGQAARKQLIFAALKSAESTINKELSPGKWSRIFPWLLALVLLMLVGAFIYLLRVRSDRKRVEALKRTRVKLATLERQMAHTRDYGRDTGTSDYNTQGSVSHE